MNQSALCQPKKPKRCDSEHDTADTLKKERKLKRWVERTSLHNILKWFDAVEYVQISGNTAAQQWTTECTERDQMFIDLLGMDSDKFGMISVADG